jgi:hypothetical protein
MVPEPNYLHLEEDLFPSITLYKELLFDNPRTGFHAEIFERVAYSSRDRSIDLTESLEHVLKKGTPPRTQSTRTNLSFKFWCSTPCCKITDSSPTSPSTPTSRSENSFCS